MSITASVLGKRVPDGSELEIFRVFTYVGIGDSESVSSIPYAGL